jgi:hypothetical protein
MKFSQLITSLDGSLSLTKLAASTAHFLMAIGFAIITWREGFKVDMWLIYGGFAIGHATVDKTVRVVKDYKDKSLDKGSGND